MASQQQSGKAMSEGKRAAWWPLVLVVGLFFLWGMANNLNDVLIAHFRKALSLGDFSSGLVQSAFYLGYFCLAVPAALVMRRFGYKGGLLLGLGLYAAGALLFLPAAARADYALFLAALFIIAGGLAFLETAANPMVAALGDPAGAAWRLNLAQAFNPLGSIAGIELGRRFILGGADAGLAAVRGPYLAIAALVTVWGVLMAITRFPALAQDRAVPATGSFDEYRMLLARPGFRFGVLAQFCYVGAQVGVWSYLIRYAQVTIDLLPAAAAGYVTVSLVLFALGRFAGSAAMARWQPTSILLLAALINAALVALAVVAGGVIGVWALAGTGLFMSVMYPTIFVLTIARAEPATKAGSSLLVMAIVGGAAFTALMGRVSDASSIRFAMLVPLGCFVVVAAFARAAMRWTRA